MAENERKDIEELTNLLRGDEEWRELREDLTAEGFDVFAVLLAFLLESEEGDEHGALVTDEDRIFRFIRAPGPEGKGKKQFVLFKDIMQSSAAIAESKLQIETALEMVG